MKIGLISDTHDDLKSCYKACEAFKADGVKTVLHAGDMISPFMVPVFEQAKLKLIAVFGNNDGDRVYLSRKYQEAGFELHPGPYEFDLGSRRICMMHEPYCLESLVKSGNFDLVVYGHTHKLDIREEGTLVINPGEGCGYLSGKPTCAVVDLSDMSGRIIDL
jgi:putative phosphoesterase